MDVRKEFDRLRNRGILAKECGTVCVCCGAMEGIAYHHILPLSMGGDNRFSNIVPVCEVCHGKIHGKHMTCLQRFSERNGRPRKDKPYGADVVIEKYLKGRITSKQAKIDLRLDRGSRLTEQWYYKEYLKNKGIKSVQRTANKAWIETMLYKANGEIEVYKSGMLVE